ncbi:MAG TPA: hypothetical protein VJY41_09890 [Prolixibacteraceae bacterium]|nr:hypothetical protein [Prolixibacteraceae bacterium]
MTVDQLEVLLRTIPQYFLFAILSLYLFGWINKKNNLGAIAEILIIVLSISSSLVLTSGLIPSPQTEGVVQEHIESVIKMLTLFALNGILALISLVLRCFLKKPFKPLVFATFIFTILMFFTSTKLSKVKFELNIPQKTEQSTIDE